MSRERIDCIVALIMALDRASRQEEFTYVYDKRGALFITLSNEWVEARRLPLGAFREGPRRRRGVRRAAQEPR